MVSLENRFLYMERLKESPKLKAFYRFIHDNEVGLSNYGNDSEEQFFKIISAIQTNNKTAFEEIYSKKSKSKPNRDSPAPFVNDDYLIFCLIVGICKFSIEKTWIKSIISIRTRNATTITFENILNENYLSTSNQLEVVLMFLHLYNQSIINNNILNTAYKSIIGNTTLLESRSDFQILCAFRGYDLVIEQKEASEGNEISSLKIFNQTFKTRIKFLSLILHAIIIFCVIYILFKLPIYSPETIKIIDENDHIFTLIGVSGFTFLGEKIPVIKDKSQELLMRLFGYPKELIKDKKKKTIPMS